MENAVVYIHGKGGTAEEAQQYQALFPNETVLGFDYHSETPWEACEEFSRFFDELAAQFQSIKLAANSLGAFFSLIALTEKQIKRAYLISPVVDMERLILDMLQWAGATEEELRLRGEIPADSGETLSWRYLRWVREHPVQWSVPTSILYGSEDGLQRYESIRDFAERTGADITVMPGGEHWFHTEEQLAFLNRWISEKEQEAKYEN